MRRAREIGWLSPTSLTTFRRSISTTIPVQYHRQTVRDPTGEAPGTIVVDPGQRYLYLVQPDGKARRYGIGVGREGFAWNGDAEIGR